MTKQSIVVCRYTDDFAKKRGKVIALERFRFKLASRPPVRFAVLNLREWSAL